MAGRPKRIDSAKEKIKSALDEAGRKVFTPTNIRHLFETGRQDWRLSQSMTLSEFTEFLVTQCGLEPCPIPLPYRGVTRYLWGSPSPFEVIQSVNPKGYFSHYAAIYLNELTTQVPKTLTFNVEQHNRGGGGTLTQEAVDRAFRNKCRVSTNTAPCRDYKVCVISGQNTDNLGVVDRDSANSAIRVTDVERTLIDAAVRPVYSGGVHEVAKAFQRAHGRASVSRIVSYLKSLGYTYPYHQSIGYYLERADVYGKKEISQLKAFPISVDFYLDYGMKQMDYDKTWKLFVPKEF